MTRREDWQIEADEVMKREEWQATGINRPIKVCPAETPLEFELCGYFTVGKYLLGKTPAEMEPDLGLPHEFLKYGARLYKFARLPQVSEYAYQVTADHPDGLADQGPLPRKTYYPPEVRRSTNGGYLKARVSRSYPNTLRCGPGIG